MVEIPKKALRKSQLTCLSEVKDGSHQIDKVHFTEDGVQKLAFYKRISPEHKYPELLALMCVAVSVFLRSFQGSHAAEERLVFDDNDQVVGTLSIALEGFQSFNFTNDPVPETPRERELAIPSTQTLIQKNIMEILVARFFLDDDDAHGHNLGFSGDHSVHLDYDMFFIWLTRVIKGERSVLIESKTRVSHSTNDWENFPVIDTATYHWPTRNHPGEDVLPTVFPGQKSLIRTTAILPKQYVRPDHFQNLAGSPEAQEQKLAAALNILVTYQPDVLRTRLSDHIGDRALNYTSLPQEQVTQFETAYPSFFNTQTNTKPFIDFMQNLYQEHYDSLYRVVVFHMGLTRNNFGISLPATSSALYLKPSFYQNIVTWVTEQNNSYYSGEGGLSSQLNLGVLEKRYHQVWRDAFAPGFKNALQSTVGLIKTLLIKLSAASNNPSAVPLSIVSKEATDNTVTKAWDIFGDMPELTDEKIKSFINVDPDSTLRAGLKELFDFANQFHTIIKTYYDKTCADLEVADSQRFFSAINTLYTDYDISIREKLAVSTNEAVEFSRISHNLHHLATQAYFRSHLLSRDEVMKDIVAGVISQKILPLTHEEVQAQFNQALFDWAKTCDLSRLLNTIIDANNTNSWAPLPRADTVKAYLRSSNESNDNRLAYIFSSGRGDKLNQLLIEHLAPEVLKVHHIPSMKAVSVKTFREHIPFFASSVERYAKKDARFTHLLSSSSRALFCATWFDWIGALSPAAFTNIQKVVLNDYKSSLSLFRVSDSREAEFNGYVRTHKSPQKIAAMTFRGGDNDSALNKALFHKIIQLIQADVRRSPDKKNDPGYKLIAQYDPEQHASVYLLDIKEASVQYTHQKANTSSRASVSSL